MGNIVLGFIMLIVISGCANPLIQHSYEKNYSLGETKTAYIGQPVISVRDFYRDYDETQKTYKMKPSSDFELTGNYDKPIKIHGNKEITYTSKGNISLKGISYTIIYMKNEADRRSDEIGILVDKSGKIFQDYIVIKHHISELPWEQKLRSSSIQPKDLTIIKGEEVNVIDESDMWANFIIGCQINYELIYGGINNVSINMAYREYTVDNLARPAFFQNVVFETNAKQIRFKDITLDILDVSNEKIVYKVVSDGLKDTYFQSKEAPYSYRDCLYKSRIR